MVQDLREISYKQLENISGAQVVVREKPGMCPICGSHWHVQKTIPRKGMTLRHGCFEARETVHVCSKGCQYSNGQKVIRRASLLSKELIPAGNVGYDVMVFVGRERFCNHSQRGEIRELLINEYGVTLSTGEISTLAVRFLQSLKVLH
jgi:hypothetical protein